jgi:hypothetical protein
LQPVQLLDRVKYREIGCDLFSTSSELPRIHLKVYTTRNPYRGENRQRALVEFARGLG